MEASWSPLGVAPSSCFANSLSLHDWCVSVCLSLSPTPPFRLPTSILPCLTFVVVQLFPLFCRRRHCFQFLKLRFLLLLLFYFLLLSSLVLHCHRIKFEKRIRILFLSHLSHLAVFCCLLIHPQARGHSANTNFLPILRLFLMFPNSWSSRFVPFLTLN